MTVTDPLLTANHDGVTRSNPRQTNCCEHCQTDVHEIGRMVAEIHELMPLLIELLPAPMRHKLSRLRNGGKKT